MSVNAETPEQGIRVYILDDHDMIRRGLRDILTEAGGFEVIGESASAREAARRIPALRPHVALLDLQVPDGSGVEVCRQVRAHDPSIRALMVTTFDDQDARMAAVMAGASGFVLKVRRLSLRAPRARARSSAAVSNAVATPLPRASGATASPSTPTTCAFSGSGRGEPSRMYPTTAPSITPTRKAWGGLSVRKKTDPACWITDGNPLRGDHEILSSRASCASSEARATRISTRVTGAVM